VIEGDVRGIAVRLTGILASGFVAVAAAVFFAAR
jgi:hypothetical protein